MTPYAFGGGITKAEAYQACGSALGNRGYSTTVSGRIDTAISSIIGGIVGNVKSALTEQGFTSAVAGFLDTAISSRAKLGDAMSLNASAMSHIQTALTNQGYTAARGAKLDKLDTSISSRAAVGAAMSLNASAMTHIQTAMTNQGYTAARSGYLDNIIKDIEDAVGTATMDGNENTIKEFTSLTQRMDCYLDLANMASGDTIVLKQYMKIKSGGSYRMFGMETYVGAQAAPLVYLELKPAKYGFKITLQQTGGTNRNVDWQTYKQVKSG